MDLLNRQRITLGWLVLLICLPWLAGDVLLVQQTAAAQGGDQAWLLNQINSLRANLGLHAYVWNAQLAAAAQAHSEYMAATGHVSHTQTNGSTPASRAAANGYSGSWVSENIYGGGLAQASDAWQFWLNSPVHYAGLAHQRNNEIGIGVATGPHGQYFTLVFGYRASIQAPPAQDVAGDAPAQPADSGDPPASENNNEPPPPPPATRVPPTRTFTPTPTIPTLTPTVTWTMTPTWTPSPTVTEPPPTATPITLPTIAAIVASATPSLTATPSPTQEQSPALFGAAGNPGSEDQGEDEETPLMLFVVAGGAVLGLGLLLVGYGVYFLRHSAAS